MTAWLVRSTLDRAVRFGALAGDIVLCSWARHLTLKVSLPTQVYKWIPVMDTVNFLICSAIKSNTCVRQFRAILFVFYP